MEFQNIKQEIYQVSSGEIGTEETLAVIKNWAIKASVNPEIIYLVRQITHNVNEADLYGKAEAIRKWVSENIKYEEDVSDIETLIEPITLLNVYGSGDCDCQSILIASLLLASGIPARFAIIGSYNNRTHIFTEAYIKEDSNGNKINKWLKVDSTDRTGKPVSEYKGAKRVFEINSFDGLSLDTLKSNGLANLGESNDPIWLQILQTATKTYTDIESMKERGELTDEDINRAISSVISITPSKESGTLSAQTIKNVPKYVSAIKTTKKIVDFFSSPVVKIAGIGIVVLGIVYLSTSYKKKTKRGYTFKNEVI